MADWNKVNGCGQPHWQTIQDCVFSSIRGGNQSAPVDIRVYPQMWEGLIGTAQASRALQFEPFENSAAIITYVYGRKTRITATLPGALTDCDCEYRMGAP